MNEREKCGMCLYLDEPYLSGHLTCRDNNKNENSLACEMFENKEQEVKPDKGERVKEILVKLWNDKSGQIDYDEYESQLRKAIAGETLKKIEEILPDLSLLKEPYSQKQIDLCAKCITKFKQKLQGVKDE